MRAMGYPCLCLCLALEQITRTTPRRRTTLHLSQIFRTDARTFISPSGLPNDPSPRRIPGCQFHDDPVADQHPHEIPLGATSSISPDVGRNPVFPVDLHLVEPARQLRRHGALYPGFLRHF